MNRLTIGTAGFALAASPSLAEQANQLANLAGETPADVELALGQRGFDFIDSNNNSMGYTYSHWWDGGDKTCVQVEARGNRVESITDAAKSDCHHSGDDAAVAAVGIVAGAAILGALLSHKSNHHDSDQHHTDQNYEQKYERGYRDGLYNASYHNSDRSEAYSSGYEAGVDERNANLRSHHGRGGYAQVADYHDLQGARAAGAMDELTSRGFRQVDNFTSGDARYSIQWRQTSHQCLQVLIADGHVEDIRDIGAHPKCR